MQLFPRFLCRVIKMASHQSYSPNYFALNDILCTEERLFCRIEVDLPGLGRFDSSSETKKLEAGSKLLFPLWLADSLTSLQNRVISIDVPSIYKEGYRELLEAAADAIDLNEWNPYFYELGLYLQKLDVREAELITKSLLQTFKSRFRLVTDSAQDPMSDPTLEFRLPRLERDIYHFGRQARARLSEWLRMGTNSIYASEITTNLKKRKRVKCELD